MTTLMEVAFYVAAAVAVVSTVLAITRLMAVHALLYLIVSLLAVAVVFYTMGAPLVAALEVIIYAGAIVVLFVFVVMMLNLGAQAREPERQWLAGTHLDRACHSLRHPARGSDLFDRRAPGPSGRSAALSGPKADGDRSLWSLSARRGTGFHAAAGRAGGRLPSGAARTSEKGGSMMTAIPMARRADSRRQSCSRSAWPGS